MPLVVDASVAVKFVLREVGSDAARHFISIPDPLIAPDWLLAEAASTFWKKVKRSELLAIHAERNLEALPVFFEQLYPSRELVREALRWSLQLRHPVYDCLYFALAVREGCEVVTADEKFHRALDAAGFGDRARLLE